MPRSVGNTVENSFIQGLITEATGLNFPEQACADTQNCIFDQRGIVSRRRGFDYEADATTSNQTRSNSVIVEYVWNSVAGTGTINFVVVQIGSLLHFYNIGTSSSLSSGKKSFTVDLESRKAAGAPPVSDQPCSFAAGKGVLFVSHPYIDPFYVTYSPDTDTISNTVINVQIRDTDGISDELSLFDTRPTTLTKEHKYNLYNQGWYVTVRLGSGFSSPDSIGQGNPLDRWDSQRSDFPSNADIWWLYKDTLDNFNTSYIGQNDPGNTPAPRGHYILKAFFQDRSAISGVAGIPVVSAGFQRPQAIGFYAGRVWYAGVNAAGYNTKIYYTQVLDTLQKIGYCYQQNDPTSEAQNDLLATDGGVLDILEVGNIIKLFPTQNALIIFANNGIWSIAGNEGTGFTGTDFSVKKISATPTLSALSFVDALGVPIWWNLDGIYTLSINGTGQFGVQSLTDESIKTFYESIPQNNKRWAKGTFNPLTKIIQWLYNNTLQTDTENNINYNSVLNLNTLTGAFYPWVVSGLPTLSINGIICTVGTGTVQEEDNVTDNALVLVTNSGGAAVTSLVSTSIESTAVFKYLTSKRTTGTTYQITWSEVFDTAYGDWRTPNAGIPLNYDSYAITGYKIHGQAIVDFQPNTIVFYMNTVNDSACRLQTIWDYSNSFNSNLESTWKQMYREKPFRDVQIFQDRLMGMGKAFQFKIFSEPFKPFEVIGWALWESVNSAP